MDVLFRNGAYLFLGWMASPQQPARQGLWYSKVLSADGKAPGSFAVWHPLIYELNGVTWHDSGPATSASHQTGLFGATLEQLHWRRRMLYGTKIGGDLNLFHQEYPTTPQEAFVSSGRKVFSIPSLRSIPSLHSIQSLRSLQLRRWLPSLRSLQLLR